MSLAMATETLRSFLALPFATYFSGDISDLMKSLKNVYPQIGWVSPFEIHTTLHFFGSINQDDIARISDIARRQVFNTRPIELFLEGLGAFPTTRKPRVIWVGIRGAVDKLKDLQLRLEADLRRASFPCEDRNYHPHLTLGRVREKGQAPPLESLKFGPTRSVLIRELVLFKSCSTPQGAHYEAIETYPFSS